MSETETHIGKVKKIEVENVDSFLRDKIRVMDEEYADKSDSEIDAIAATYDAGYIEWYSSEYEFMLGSKVVIANDDIYEVVENRELEYEDISMATTNADGTISYVIQYYNGGCGFSEALESALKKLDE